MSTGDNQEHIGRLLQQLETLYGGFDNEPGPLRALNEALIETKITLEVQREEIAHLNIENKQRAHLIARQADRLEAWRAAGRLALNSLQELHANYQAQFPEHVLVGKHLHAIAELETLLAKGRDKSGRLTE